MYFPNNKHAAAADLLQETTISNIIRIQSKSINKVKVVQASRVSNSEIKKFYSHYLEELLIGSDPIWTL
jgi:hypothetical protein